MREMERERADASLEVKKSENHQILKENIELKRQMEERQRQMQGGMQGAYNPSELQARQREELEKYYMYQRQRALDERRYLEQHGRDPHGPKPLEMMSPREREARERELQERERKEGEGSRDRSASRDGRSDSAKPQERKESDGKRSVSPGPRGTPNKEKPPVSMAGGLPPGYPPAAAQFYPPHGYPYHHPGVPIDPGHPMYRGMNPIIGFAGPAYVHPSQIPRYHMSPPVEAAGTPEKDKLLVSPGGAPPPPHTQPHPGAEHGGKALDLLQQHAQHASQYYGSPQGGPPGHHKIHELTEVGRKEGAASPTGKPGERESREREREGSPFR